MLFKYKNAIATLFLLFTLEIQATNFTKLEQAIERVKDNANLPSGTAIIALLADGSQYQFNIGYANIDQLEAVDSDTPFYIASVTKPLYALALLIEEEKQQLATKTNIGDMFPELRDLPFANDITIQHLLTHTSGLKNDALTMVSAYRGNSSPDKLLEIVAHTQEDKTSLFNHFDYTNLGYNLISVWQQSKKGVSWQDTINNNLLIPLSTNNTHTSITNRIMTKLPKVYSFASEKNTPLNFTKQNDTMHSAGGVFSSANDLAKFLSLQLEPELVSVESPIYNAIKRSQQIVTTVDSEFGEFKRTGYAWGWYTGPFLDRQLYHHFGGYSGTHAHVSFMPKEKLGLIILNNEDMLSSRLTGMIAKAIYAKLLNDEVTYRDTVESITQFANSLPKIKQHLVQQKQQRRTETWQLSAPLKQYVGHYQHSGYGNMHISLTEHDQLQVNWGHTQSIATAYKEKDSMRVELIPNRGQVIKFITSENIKRHIVEGLTYDGAQFFKIKEAR